MREQFAALLGQVCDPFSTVPWDDTKSAVLLVAAVMSSTKDSSIYLNMYQRTQKMDDLQRQQQAYKEEQGGSDLRQFHGTGDCGKAYDRDHGEPTRC